MALVRYVAQTLTIMTELVRRELLDPSTDRSGLTVPAAQRTWSDNEVEEAIGLAIIDLDRDFQFKHPGSSLVYVDGTYDGGAVLDDVPAAIGRYQPIVKVENITDPSAPATIPYLTPNEIERFALSQQASTIVPPRFSYRHTLVDNGVGRAIVVRPRPSGGLQIRFWYIAPPVMIQVGADAIPLTEMWVDLVILKSACILLSRKNGANDQQLLRLADLMEKFKKGTRQRQPTRIRRTRKGQS